MEPRYNEVFGITNDILQSGFLKCMEQNLDITNQFPESLGTSINRLGSTAQRNTTETVSFVDIIMSYADGLLYSFLCLQETSPNSSKFQKLGACNVKMDVRLPLKCFTGSFAVKPLSSLAPLARADITTYSNQITKVVNAISRMNFPRLRWHFKVRYMAKNSCCVIWHVLKPETETNPPRRNETSEITQNMVKYEKKKQTNKHLAIFGAKHVIFYLF